MIFLERKEKCCGILHPGVSWRDGQLSLLVGRGVGEMGWDGCSKTSGGMYLRRVQVSQMGGIGAD